MLREIVEDINEDINKEVKNLIGKTGQSINIDSEGSQGIRAVLIKKMDKEDLKIIQDAGFKTSPANGGTAIYK